MKQIFYFIAICLALTACKKSNDTPATPPDPTPTPEPFIPPLYGSDTLGSWQKMNNGEFFSLSMISPAKGFALARFASAYGMYRTVDSGKTWAVNGGVPLFDGEGYLVFANERHGFYSARTLSSGFASLYQFYRTPSNNYALAQRIVFNTIFGPASFRFTQFMNDTIGYSGTNGGSLVRFTLRGDDFSYVDAGNTGAGDSFSGSASATNFQFGSMTTGYVIKNTGIPYSPKGSLRKSVDSGKTWSAITDIGNYFFTHVFVLDDSRLFAMTVSNRLYISANGGITWTLAPLPGTNSGWNNQSVFLSPNRGFVAKSNEIFEITDGGVTWSRSCKIGYYNDASGVQQKNEFNDLQVKGGYLWARIKNGVLRMKL
jgi:photosystem II stability/assembly factor-like uncharacterized protein